MASGHQHGHGHGHTHDDMDWAARADRLKVADRLATEAYAEVAARFADALPADPTVLDIGPGAGGMSAAFATELRNRGGGTLVLVDAVPELLSLAEATAKERGGDAVTVRTVLGDAAEVDFSEYRADLVWASFVVHHLPDQQAALDRLATALRSGGVLAIGEGGLEPQNLPWDLGVGRPGLEHRLHAVRADWFAALRSGMDGVVRMPYGWGAALTRAGLTKVGRFSYVVDKPVPPRSEVAAYVIDRIRFMAEIAGDDLDESDRDAIARLLDADGPDYVGARDDLYVLDTRTVHHGRAT
ncbi:class I SAM-dependent methyltransferase [Amycolatopsis magusensis]|uniref:SAM-dependent methyltransferase n=1 Tax=Amycolatopsis magusensis TaxID=882444 RepID=A0ABS4Q5X5_9PSEU|nr:class I SAM-dependent methyltransferase [Amycolatopsis magusensis]MBP2187087.1 SAM-dependent methyltransferase [Amycolatopsis magusensis]